MADQRPSVDDLLGIAPGWTGEMTTDEFVRHQRCRDAQCVAFKHTCPGCANDLHGDNFCMVSACEQEGMGNDG